MKPGWIGVASIKWVGGIEVSDEPLFSHWNTQQYVMAPAPPTQTARWSPSRRSTRPASWPGVPGCQPALAEGPLQLWARATGTACRTQSANVPFNANGYLFGASGTQAVAT